MKEDYRKRLGVDQETVVTVYLKGGHDRLLERIDEFEVNGRLIRKVEIAIRERHGRFDVANPQQLMEKIFPSKPQGRISGKGAQIC